MTKTELIEHYKSAYRGRADESIRIPGDCESKFASVSGISLQCDNAKTGDKIFMFLPNSAANENCYEVISFQYTEEITS